MSLLMKPACERCGHGLPPESDAARICSHECTFCMTCAGEMAASCPNCGGDLQRRPMRRPR